MNLSEPEVYTYDDGDRIWLGIMHQGFIMACPFEIKDWLNWLDIQQQQAQKYRIPDSVIKAFKRRFE